MKLKRKILYIFLAFFAICTVMFLTSANFSSARFLNRTVCQFVRSSLAAVTSLVPFSVFEAFIILSPVFLVFILRYIFKASVCNMRKRFVAVLSLLSLLPSFYILTIGISYRVPSPVQMKNGELTEDELISSAEHLASSIYEISDYISEAPKMRELRDELSRSYSSNLTDYGYNGQKFPLPKKVVFSRALSYIGSLALYSFPTGEVNINTEIPEYTVPFTVAHEYAHFIGIASERDANFFAFVACVNSESQYVRYSGLISGLEYLLSDIYKTDRESYLSILSALPERAASDMELYKQYTMKYKDSFVFYASDKLNSAHLGVWDEFGKHSYSQVTRCIVRYLNKSGSLRIKCSETTVFRSEKWDDLLYTGANL